MDKEQQPGESITHWIKRVLRFEADPSVIASMQRTAQEIRSVPVTYNCPEEER